MNPPGPDRNGAIDAVRGSAIVGMIAFHLAWDLHDFGWIDLDPSRSIGWSLFGHAVAACFLFLSGLGLVMARRRGAGAARALRRIGIIAAAALGVTLVTAVATPGETVRFGILHCIALADLLALPLLGAPPSALLACAATALIAPLVVAGRGPGALWWLGLSDRMPDTIDVRPLLPWLGVVLLGVWIGRLGGDGRIRRPGAFAGGAPRLLAAAGRHSLAIYLVHQPALFGLFLILAAVHPAPAGRLDPSADAAFTGQCQAACVKTTPADRCIAFCACARHRLEPDARGPGSSPEAMAEAARRCGADPSPLDPHGS